MITIQKIQSSLFSKLYDAFLVDDDPLSDEQDWRNVFDYHWDNGEGHCGYAMLADGEVVGMMGMIFSERYIAGQTRKLCNLHTWWVREDHRGRSLALLRPILKLQGYTITHFTPCDTIRAVTRKLGFEDVSLQQKLLLPFGIKRKYKSAGTDFSDDRQVIERSLGRHDKRIFIDHQPYGCGNLLIPDGDQQCYLLYTRVVRHWVPYCHIHYISNKEVFARKEPAIRSWLLRHNKAKFVAVDRRLVEDVSFRSSVNSWAPGPGLFKSDDLCPAQIDNLYSDVSFLKLTVLPDTTHELGKIARRLIPRRKK